MDSMVEVNFTKYLRGKVITENSFKIYSSSDVERLMDEYNDYRHALQIIYDLLSSLENDPEVKCNYAFFLSRPISFDVIMESDVSLKPVMITTTVKRNNHVGSLLFILRGIRLVSAKHFLDGKILDGVATFSLETDDLIRFSISLDFVPLNDAFSFIHPHIELINNPKPMFDSSVEYFVLYVPYIMREVDNLDVVPLWDLVKVGEFVSLLSFSDVGLVPLMDLNFEDGEPVMLFTFTPAFDDL